MNDTENVDWFAVRCIIDHGQDDERKGHAYEERITLWRAASFDEAMERAEAEAIEYAAILTDVRVTDLVQAFKLFEQPGDGAEVFSLIRLHESPPDAYIDAFFDTGTEFQQI